MIDKYVKKPIPIEAVKYDGSNQDEILAWGNYGRSQVNPNVWFDFNGYMHVATLEGSFKAKNKTGDYLVKGTEGEFYICEGSIFEKTYEKVSEGSAG